MSSNELPSPVDSAWLEAHLGDPNVVVVDATTHLSFPDGKPAIESGEQSYRAAHIEGAVFADLLTDFADHDAAAPWTVPSSEQFAAAAGALGIGDGAIVVIYDQHDGYWATRLWWHLRFEGFDSAVVLDGGLPAWQASGRAVTDAESTPTARTFTGVRRPELIRSTEDVAAALDDPNTILVNVLDPASYRGDNSDAPRRGHIPGSVNLPVSEIRDSETGELKSVDQLRTLFTEAGLLDTDRTVVTYCGGGIAATGVAHALALAGRDDVAVYDGSMSAWSSNPDLPLVTGPSPR
ncbi:thiosulfate/3-mercaptopyruvate sulfurtransferase [Rhodococcus sp. 27YEA15]|uniref:sulfurtransferase n=1 Tax=Rhodococcus sp. 27YEA15 TaxID=3156259 RepID=UPI003C7D74C5